MMLVQIRELVEKVKVCLPNGMLLTHILEAFEVSFKRKSLNKLQSHDEYYDWTLYKMGY